MLKVYYKINQMSLFYFINVTKTLNLINHFSYEKVKSSKNITSKYNDWYF